MNDLVTEFLRTVMKVGRAAMDSQTVGPTADALLTSLLLTARADLASLELMWGTDGGTKRVLIIRARGDENPELAPEEQGAMRRALCRRSGVIVREAAYGRVFSTLSFQIPCGVLGAFLLKSQAPEIEADETLDALAFALAPPSTDYRRCVICENWCVPIPACSASRSSSVLAVSKNTIAVSPDMCDCLARARRYARHRTPLVIWGESGTGKEHLLEEIRLTRPRPKFPWTLVNCSDIEPGLAGSALFGHRRGSFTTALADQKGLFDAAQKGVLILDNFQDLEYSVQCRLLRVIEQKECRRIGETATHGLDVRVIIVSSVDPKRLLKEGKLKEDLFHRIWGDVIFVPPLRDRREDILPLARFFLERESPGQTFQPRAEQAIQDALLPGNARTLLKLVEAVVHDRDDLGPIRGEEVLAKTAVGSAVDGDAVELRGIHLNGTGLSGMLKEIEKALIESQLKICGGKIGENARKLKVDRAHLRRRITALEICVPGRDVVVAS